MMRINEVCKKCSVTKKAVEYYIEQGLVTPVVRENGYRDFPEEAVTRLKRISVLRGLGLSAADIREILSEQNDRGAGTGNRSLNEISNRKLVEITVLQEKRKLIQELARTQDWETVQDKLLQLQKKQSVLERLRNAFPGYYGNYVCQHFAPYLDEPVVTKEQQEAFDTILDFLDGIHFELPDDLRDFYEEVTAGMDDAILENMSAGLRGAVCDIEKYIAENREGIESYMAYKQTEEYKATPAYRMAESMKQFNDASGYNDVFIPAMCRLSNTYQEYHEALQQANEKILQIYPELGRSDKA